MHGDSQMDPASQLADTLRQLRTLVDSVYPLTVPINPRFPTHTRLGTIEVFPDTRTPAAWLSTGEGLSRKALHSASLI